LEQFLDQAANPPQANDEFNVSHILLSRRRLPPRNSWRTSRHKAKIGPPAPQGRGNFGQLAIANSNSQTALDGGQLGWRKGTQLPQFILDLVTAIEARRSERTGTHPEAAFTSSS